MAAPWSHRARSLVLVALALAAWGCQDRFDPRKKLSGLDAGIRESLLPPGFRLNLPTAPIVVKKPPAPDRYPDGSLSVHGLLSRKAELLRKNVKVTAYVVELHAPAEPKCPPCTPAHLYLADTPNPADDERRLLVADFEREQVSGVEVGKRYLVTGNFETTSLSRFSRAEGLLSFQGVREAK